MTHAWVKVSTPNTMGTLYVSLVLIRLHDVDNLVKGCSLCQSQQCLTFKPPLLL